MNRETRNPRVDLIRETAVLQIKLLADGFRDAVLIPVSLIAALIGLLRGGEQADREYRRVIKLGRRSERWINLFGHQRPLGKPHPADSMDNVLGQVESAILRQYKKEKNKAKDRSSEQHDSNES
ncbi:MAG: hypothetical protein V3R56_01770 [Xanthomonadales bacterium]